MMISVLFWIWFSPSKTMIINFSYILDLVFAHDDFSSILDPVFAHDDFSTILDLVLAVLNHDH